MAYKKETGKISLGKKLLFKCPKKVVHQYYYYMNHKKLMSFKNPKLYDEKIRWLMQNVYDTSYGKYADKYLVREYIKEVGLEEILIPCLGVYDDPADIPYDSLPDQFILKSTHGSGPRHYEIITDKKSIDKADMCEKFRAALKYDYVYSHGQFHYAGCKPRVICEALLVNEENPDSRMDDYKVVCSYGKPKAILVCSDRDKGRDYYDTDWNYLEYTHKEFRNPNGCKKPDNLDKMLEYAAIISKPFPMARIDFYVLGDKIYFGEITLTPSAGNHANLTLKGQTELGNMITLPR